MENLENGKYVVITSKFNCQDYPLNEKAIFVSYEDLEQIDPIDGTKCFDLENNCVIDYDNTEYLKKQHLEELRAKRVPLLKAFDVYKSSVAYGTEIETEEQRNIIIKWYNEVKNLNEKYIIKDENIPNRIKYYL